jgi:hypothetical protein
MNKEQERRIMFIDASGLYDKAPVYFELTWDVLIQKKCHGNAGSLVEAMAPTVPTIVGWWFVMMFAFWMIMFFRYLLFNAICWTVWLSYGWVCISFKEYAFKISKFELIWCQNIVQVVFYVVNRNSETKKFTELGLTIQGYMLFSIKGIY